MPRSQKVNAEREASAMMASPLPIHNSDQLDRPNTSSRDHVTHSRQFLFVTSIVLAIALDEPPQVDVADSGNARRPHPIVVVIHVSRTGQVTKRFASTSVAPTILIENPVWDLHSGLTLAAVGSHFQVQWSG